MTPISVGHAVALVLLATACAASCAGPAGSTPPVSSQTVAPQSPPPVADAHFPPPAPVCATTQLSFTITAPEGGAGTWRQRLVFTNHGQPCNLRGFPIVAYRDSSGHTVAYAQRFPYDVVGDQPPAHAPVAHLASEGQASAEWTYSLAGPHDSCPNYATATVTPPNNQSGWPFPLATSTPAQRICQNRVGVTVDGVPPVS